MSSNEQFLICLAQERKLLKVSLFPAGSGYLQATIMCLFLVLLFNQLIASRFIFTQNLVWQLLVFVAIRLNPHVIREL